MDQAGARRLAAADAAAVTAVVDRLRRYLTALDQRRAVLEPLAPGTPALQGRSADGLVERIQRLSSSLAEMHGVMTVGIGSIETYVRRLAEARRSATTALQIWEEAVDRERALLASGLPLAALSQVQELAARQRMQAAILAREAVSAGDTAAEELHTALAKTVHSLVSIAVSYGTECAPSG